jgi:hypothetical protein
MADDKMKNDDRQRNMGGADKAQNQGQQAPGRAGQGEQAGQHAGGQQSGGPSGGQKGTRNMEDDKDDFGAGQVGTQNRGSEKR